MFNVYWPWAPAYLVPIKNDIWQLIGANKGWREGKGRKGLFVSSAATTRVTQLHHPRDFSRSPRESTASGLSLTLTKKKLQTNKLDNPCQYCQVLPQLSVYFTTFGFISNTIMLTDDQSPPLKSYLYHIRCLLFKSLYEIVAKVTLLSYLNNLSLI